MSEPFEPVLPPSGDDAQKQRASRKGMRPKLPTLELTATSVETNGTPSEPPSETSSDALRDNQDSAPSSAEPAVNNDDSSAVLSGSGDAPFTQNIPHSEAVKSTSASQDTPRAAPSLLSIAPLLLASGLIGGAVVYGLGAYYGQSAPVAANTTALEERLSTLERASSASSESASRAEIETLVTERLAAQGNAAPRDNASTAKLSELEQKLAALTAQLQGFTGQVDALATKTEQFPQGAVLQNEITALEQKLDSALTENQQQLNLNRSGALILEIERALRYGRAFATPLQQLKSVMPNLNTTALEPYAQGGVPRMHVLAAQMNAALADTPYEASVAEPSAAGATEPGLWDQLKESASSLVKVSPSGEIAESSPRAPMKAALDAEDWPGVLREQKKLDNAAYTATRELAASLEARLDAEKALAALNTQLYSSPVLGPQPTE